MPLFREQKSLNFIAWRRFRKQKLAIFFSLLLVLILLLSFASPFLTRYDPIDINLSEIYQKPSPQHLMGTDSLGRDVWSRILYGGRISLTVGFLATLISTSIGFFLGAFAGYYGKKIDLLIMRFVDVMGTFPPFFIMMTLASILEETSLLGIVVIIGGFQWPLTARLVRDQFLSLKNQDFVLVTHTQGLPGRLIIIQHLLPHIATPLLLRISFTSSTALLAEAGLSFLNIGIPSPVATWGNMIEPARSLNVLQSYPWIWAWPTFFLLITIVSINFINEGLRNTFAPHQMI